MKRHVIIVVCFLVLIPGVKTGFGQTVALPDTNLVNKLQQDYSQVMQGNELDTAAAANLTGTLNLSNANIYNASGIEYFTGITALNLNNNNLDSIPDISATSGLVYLFADNNQLTSLPSLDSLTQLRDLQVMHNDLDTLPDLGNTDLRRLYCTDNNITAIPSLSQLTNLERLVIGNNPIKWPIDFSVVPNLTQLHIHKTNADTIIGLESLTNLEFLYAWGNNIRNFSGLDSITSLTKCVIYDNPIRELPYLANKTNLNELVVVECYLTFQDIKPVLNDAPSKFDYGRQRTFGMNDRTVRITDTLSLNQPIGDPLGNNIYVWRKNGRVIDSSASKELTFDPVRFSDSGDYVLNIYNPDVPELVLATDTFHVAVKPCLELSLSDVNITNKDCSNGYSIDLSNAQIDGGTKPFRYTLTNSFFNKTFDKLKMESIPAGDYQFTVKGAQECSASANFTLNRIRNCDAVLTPNGDGVADTYYIKGSGTVKIYNMKRQLVKTLEAPANWDGTDQNGSLLDTGYYIIIKEDGSTQYISIMR